MTEVYETLPIVPLPDVVVFPHLIMPFVIGRPSSIRALEHALGKDKRVFLAAQHDGSFEEVEHVFFLVRPGASMDRTSGSLGQNITMTGSGFAAAERDIIIFVSGQAVRTGIRADNTGYWQDDFAVPLMPKGTHNVTAEGESTPQSAVGMLSFNITPGLVVSPDQGHVGMDLTVTGSGFPVNRT